MARALMGHVGSIGSAGEQVLGLEIARLRRRVGELEAENALLRERATAVADVPTDFDLELHRIAEVAEPVLL